MSPIQHELWSALRGGRRHEDDLQKDVPLNIGTLRKTLMLLEQTGFVREVSPGVWEASE